MAAVSAAETAGEVPSPVDSIRQAAAEALAKHDEAVRQAEIRPGDPLEPAMAVQREFIAWTGNMAETIARAASQGARGLTTEGEAELVRRIAARGDTATVEVARALKLRTILLAAGLFAGGIVVAGVLGYWRGYAAAVADVRETEDNLQAAFRAGANAAARWVDLMRLNDLPSVLAACTGDRAFTDQLGSPACYAPLRLGPPKPPVVAKAGR